MRDSQLPLATLPNIGLVTIIGGRVVYPHSTPEYFAEFAAQASELGARIIGGCCGTTPGADRVDPQRGRRAAPAAPGLRGRRGRAAHRRRRHPRARRSSHARYATGEWVVSVELDPPKGGTSTAMIEVSRALRASGHVGFVDVNDNPMARARMNALMASVAIQRETGIETIPHVTPRDTTVMGLEGVLLGAHAEGVRNILAVTGDPPHVGDYPGSRGVYEIDSIGLVHLIARLNQGEDYVGKAIDQPTSFFTGVAVNPTADDLPLELARFEQKIAAGARFAMTQALFDAAQLEPLLERYSGAVPIPVLVGVWPLRSYAWRCACTTRCPASACPSTCSRRCATPAPTRRRSASRWRASSSRPCARRPPAST